MIIVTLLLHLSDFVVKASEAYGPVNFRHIAPILATIKPLKQVTYDPNDFFLSASSIVALKRYLDDPSPHNLQSIPEDLLAFTAWNDLRQALPADMSFQNERLSWIQP